MSQTVLTELGNLKSFTHGLDSTHPFQIYFSRNYHTGIRIIGDVHLDPQLFIILSGKADFYLDGEIFKGRAGEIFISNFWEPHAFRPGTGTGPLAFLVVTFSVFSLGAASPFSDFDWLLFLKQPVSRRKIIFTGKDEKEILHLAWKLIELTEERPSGYQSMQWLLIHEIMFLVNSKFISAAARSVSRGNELPILPVLKKIRHDPGCDISLNEAAALCSMSRSAFCQVFKKIMNESFSRFSMKSRIGYSCILLRSQKFTIKEVSDQCGFKNITHFYHVFKKIRKCTPVEFTGQPVKTEKTFERRNLTFNSGLCARNTIGHDEFPGVQFRRSMER